MNILEICQEVADISSTLRPTDLFDPNSQHNSIFLSIVKAELNSLMRYGDWQDLTKEGTLLTVKNKTVYPIDNIVPDFYSILNNTIYIKDEMEAVIGAITPEDWMREKYFSCPSVDIKFKIQGNAFKFLELPDGGKRIVFQYRSNAVCYDATTFEEKPSATKNTDIPIFDKYVVQLGILWRWLKRNGMDYSEEYNEYQNELKKKFGTGLATKDIDLSAGEIDLADGGIIVNVKVSES